MINLPDKNDLVAIPQKYLDKIMKMQQDQEGARQQEYELLRMHLAQMNVLLDQLISVTGSGSTVAATKKFVPFQTGSQPVGQLLIPPTNQDGYPTRVEVYKINDNRVIPHMTLIADGPGDIFFISAYAKDVFNTEEEHLNVNDQRELFNVYEIRLRSTLPKTTFRLIEGIFRTGSFAPQTKANVEIRPTIQTNEILKVFDAIFEIKVPTITITSPTVQTLPAIYPLAAFQPPLPPGATATFVDRSTSTPMPFLIPTGFILEAFAYFGNTSTDCTIRVWAEPVPNSAAIFGATVFALSSVLPFSNRGIPFNFVPNINFYSTQLFDPLGAPAPGRFALFTITNDDPFNNMIGNPFFVSILRQIT